MGYALRSKITDLMTRYISAFMIITSCINSRTAVYVRLRKYFMISCTRHCEDEDGTKYSSRTTTFWCVQCELMCTHLHIPRHTFCKNIIVIQMQYILLPISCNGTIAGYFIALARSLQARFPRSTQAIVTMYTLPV